MARKSDSFREKESAVSQIPLKHLLICLYYYLFKQEQHFALARKPLPATKLQALGKVPGMVNVPVTHKEGVRV